MAHLGTIAQWDEEIVYSKYVTSPNIQQAHHLVGTLSLHRDVTGTISGVVGTGSIDQPTPVPGVRVALIYRSNMLPVSFAITDVDGQYAFEGLDKSDIGSFMVVAIDPRDEPEYNFTVVHDHLTAG